MALGNKAPPTQQQCRLPQGVGEGGEGRNLRGNYTFLLVPAHALAEVRSLTLGWGWGVGGGGGGGGERWGEEVFSLPTISL